MKFNELKDETKSALKLWCALPTSVNAFEQLVYCLIVNENKIGNNAWEELIMDYKNICLANSIKDSNEKFSFNDCINEEYIDSHFHMYEIMRDFFNFLIIKKYIINV